MLCFILTDIRIGAPDLNRALLSAVEPSFNRIIVDGDTSTNDTVLVMANGMAGNERLDNHEYKEFFRGLQQVMSELAFMIVKDG